MRKKFLTLLTAAALALNLSACSGGSPQTTSGTDKSETSASEPAAPLSAESYTYWNGIDRSKVIAYAEGVENPEEFDITFGEFYGEYLYYLLSYNISDDMIEKNKDSCKSFREDIISYLQFDRICRRVAEEMGLMPLTEDELSQIQASADENYEAFLSKYYSIAAEELGEGASEEQIREKEKELLKGDLARAELTEDIFYRWEQGDFIRNKLVGKICEGIEITEEQIDKEFEANVQAAKDALADNPLSYESNAALSWIYVPEGTRLADQILLMFDEETRGAISDARNAGNDEEADRLREEAYEKLKEKAESVAALIEKGTDFDELQETYNEDGGNEPYSVIVGSQMYVPEFTNAVFSIPEIGGVSAPTVSDYGVHIIKYVGDDFVSDEELAEIRESMKSYLTEKESAARQEKAYNEWVVRYPYTVDIETLLLDPPDSEQSG